MSGSAGPSPSQPYFHALQGFCPLAFKGVPYDWAALKRLDTETAQATRTALGLKPVFVCWPLEIAGRKCMSSEPLFKKAARFHAFQRLTQAVVALRLYRYEHGRYPDGLQALVPKFLPKVPIDPFDGKPLRYRKLSKGLKVWSVGSNF